MRLEVIHEKLKTSSNAEGDQGSPQKKSNCRKEHILHGLLNLFSISVPKFFLQRMTRIVHL